MQRSQSKILTAIRNALFWGGRVMCSFQFNLQSKCSPRYFTTSVWGMIIRLMLTAGQWPFQRVNNDSRSFPEIRILGHGINYLPPSRIQSERKSRAICLLPPWTFMVCSWVIVYLYLRGWSWTFICYGIPVRQMQQDFWQLGRVITMANHNRSYELEKNHNHLFNFFIWLNNLKLV
jgi:hypothetical protein